MKAAAKTRTSKPARRQPMARAGAARGHAPAFREIVGLIQSARRRAFQAVNTELIGLYWRVGEYVSRNLATAAWGEGVEDELARYIAQEQPDIKGYTRRNLFRMRQLFGTYRAEPKVSALRTQLHPEAETIFKDSCLLDFLDLPADHSERDLQRALVKNLKQFLIGLGPDFCFAGEELRLPDRVLLQPKLREFYQLAMPETK
jgi:hypothetical protein